MVMRKTLGKTPISLSVESIAFQTKAFGNILEGIVKDIRDSGVRDAKSLVDIGFDKLILNAIKDYTNIEFEKVEFAEGYNNLSVTSRVMTINHVFDAAQNWKYKISSDNAEKHLSKIGENNATSYVDLETGKVYGYFRKVGIKLVVGLPMLIEPKRTPAGVAAYILHEVGHVISYCEFYNRISTTNQVLAAIARSVEKEPVEKMKILFTSAAKTLNLPPKTFDGLENVKDEAVVCTVIIDAALHNVSQINSGIYDQVTNEQTADNYVARQGYGRALLETIDETHDLVYGSAVSEGQKAAIISTFFIGLVCAAVPIITVSAAAASAIMYSYFNILGGGCRTYNYNYDTVKTRMKRVREQIVEYVKDPSLTAAQKKSTLEDLERADTLINNKSEAKENLFDKIANFVRKDNKSLKDTITLQRNLEELSANDLFIRAAQLGTL